jgi:tRNA(Ile)-lysidine synthase
MPDIDASAESLHAYLANLWPSATWRDVRVAVAVSGGPDSVALLRVIAGAKQASAGRGDVAVVHLDHRVRGEASRRDAEWVRELAQGLGLPLVVESTAAAGSRSEEALRDERREFYRRAADALGARFIATGHTADDQAETVLFRLLRGTGLRGAAGIRPMAPLTPACALVRPLLGVTRGELIAYLAAIGQPYRSDNTNHDDNYARNWLRNQALPHLTERFPTAASELAGFAERAAETSDLIEALAFELMQRATETTPTSTTHIVLRSTMLAQSPQLLVVEALRLVWRKAGWPQQAMTALHWRRLGELATATLPQAATVFPGGVRADRQGDLLVLARPPETGSC